MKEKVKKGISIFGFVPPVTTFFHLLIFTTFWNLYVYFVIKTFIEWIFNIEYEYIYIYIYIYIYYYYY